MRLFVLVAFLLLYSQAHAFLDCQISDNKSAAIAESVKKSDYVFLGVVQKINNRESITEKIKRLVGINKKIVDQEITFNIVRQWKGFAKNRITLIDYNSYINSEYPPLLFGIDGIYLVYARTDKKGVLHASMGHCSNGNATHGSLLTKKKHPVTGNLVWEDSSLEILDSLYKSR